MESHVIAEAVVVFKTEGDTTDEVARQQANADRASRRHAQQQQQQQRQQQQQTVANQRQTNQQGAPGSGLTNPQHGQALQYQRQQAQRQQQQQQQQAKLANESAERRRKGLEAARDREKRAALEEEREGKRVSDARRMKLLKVGALTKMAFGSLPFVGAGADIAMAGAAGGPVGAAAMAAGKGIQYGMEGAQKADPATFERMKYQMDRLQAGIGSGALPTVNRFTRGLEKATDYLFGSGFQLSHPQISSYSEMQDRLQMEALRKAPEIPPDAPGARGMKGFQQFGFGPAGIIAAGGSMVSKDFADAVDKFSNTAVGRFTSTVMSPLNAMTGTGGIRGIMDALDM